MKTKIFISVVIFFICQITFAQIENTIKMDSLKVEKSVQNTKIERNATNLNLPVTTTVIVQPDNNVNLEANLKAEKKALKAQRKVEKKQNKLDREKRNFERGQKKIASREKTVIRTKDKLEDAKSDLLKLQTKFDKKQSKGKLDAIEIEKFNIKISKQQIKIQKLMEDEIKDEKKLNRLRN